MRRNRHLLLPLLILTFLCAQHVLAASTLQKPANVRWVTGKTATAAWDSVNGIDHYRVMIHVVHGIDPLGNREIHTKDTEIDLEKDILFIINSGYDSVQVTFDVAAVFDGTVYQYSGAVSSGSIEYYLKGDLNKAKDDAKAEVNGVDANSYVTSDRQAVTDSKETAINAIDAAKTEDEVRGAVETFFTAIQDCVPQAKADQDAANEVVAKTNAIGTVAYTTASKGKIDAARTAYNGLSSAQKALVTNVNVLNAAETRYRELKAAAEAAAKKKAAEEAAKKKASLEKITIEKTPSSVKAKAKKNKVTVSWKKIKKNKAGKKLLKQIKSIQVQYSTDLKFKQNVKTKTVGKKKTKVKLKLQKKTTYYIRVRYKGSNGFSKWSKVKKVKTKK